MDEAGRGPLAGPVVAAAVVIEPEFAMAEEHGLLASVMDSKKLSPARREALYDMLCEQEHIRIGLASIEAGEIDRINILQATHHAMFHAVAALRPAADFLLIDGLPVSLLPEPKRSIVGGDGLSLSIAAASIVAKVTRDQRMLVLAHRYPNYGFEQHKGYGSSRHIQALFEFGPCPEHRRSFRPVREAEAIHAGAGSKVSNLPRARRGRGAESARPYAGGRPADGAIWPARQQELWRKPWA